MNAPDKYTINLIKKTALLSTVVTCCGALIMYIFGQQAIALSKIAAFVCFIMLIMLALVYKKPNNPYNGIILIATILLVIFLPTTFSGGVNSRFSVLIPIVPTIMCLVLTKRMAISLTVLMGLFVLTTTILVDHIPDYTNMGHIRQELFAKTLWLIMALFMALTFGLVFVDINAKLTMKLESSESKSTHAGVFDKQAIIDFAHNRLIKLAGSKSNKYFISLILIDTYAEAQTIARLTQDEILNKVARSANKVIKQDTDMVGKLSDHQILMCVLVQHRKDANAAAANLLSLLQNKVGSKELPIDANMGLITVDKSIGVDVHSLISIAEIALRRAKQNGLNTCVDYADLKNS